VRLASRAHALEELGMRSRASKILRGSIKQHFEQPLSGQLAGGKAALRAASGADRRLPVMHRMIGSPALVEDG
jgi:hypothetical protein